MVSLKSGFPLLEDERLILEIESKLYMTSPWLPLRFIWGIIRPFLQILGFKRSGYLIATDKRFIEFYTQTIFWLIKFRKYSESISLKKIKGNIHWVKKGRFLFFCRAYQVCYNRPWWRVYFILKGKEEDDANKIINLLNQAVCSAQTRRAANAF
ncbi:MAG: hypothetical protein FWD40_01805 [Treponema sp.]|nr:hypothetical protein [Treponema sp.]